MAILSEKNREKIVMSGLYTCKPVLKWLPSYRRDDPYHCMNWTFRPSVYTDGNLYMRDTYFNNASIKLTDENIHLFTLLFDYKDVTDVGKRRPDDYEETDYFRAAIGSGGISDAHYFLKKSAKPSIDKRIENHREEINEIVYQIDRLQSMLKEKMQNLAKLEREKWVKENLL